MAMIERTGVYEVPDNVFFPIKLAVFSHSQIKRYVLDNVPPVQIC